MWLGVKMLELIKEALMCRKSTNDSQKPTTFNINYDYIPLIATKNYHLKPQNISMMSDFNQILDLNNIFIQYKARVIIDGKQIFSLFFMHNNMIEEICRFILNIVSGNREFMYMQIKTNVFTRDPDFLRESLDHLQVHNFSFLRFGSEIGSELFPNMEMQFFDGKHQIYTVKIERINCVYAIKKIEVGEFYDKVTLCKGCGKNNSEVCVMDDPILPQREKYLCKKCFNLLFLDERGNVKYKDMDYKFI